MKKSKLLSLAIIVSFLMHTATSVSALTTQEYNFRVDFNGDGKNNVADVIYLKRWLAGWGGYEIIDYGEIPSTTQTIETTSTETPPTTEVPISKGIQIYGSFIQGWYVRDWSEQRWETEFSAMKEAGLELIIIQSVADFSYSGVNSESNMNSGSLDSLYSLYHSDLPEFSSQINYSDQLENAFKAADKYGIKIMIGSPADDRWFSSSFGWNPPAENGKYLSKWLNNNDELTNKVAEEITDKYISRYPNAFGGWYYHSEIWNIYPAYAKLDGGITAELLGRSIANFAEKIEEITPNKPLLLSPFYSHELYEATPENNGEFWKDILSYTVSDGINPTPIIFAPQDSVGAKNVPLETLDNWTKQLKNAASYYGYEFWSNNENFTLDFKPADLTRFIKQLEITDSYAEKHICFSWNHYYSPIYESGKFSEYNNKYIEYVKEGKID